VTTRQRIDAMTGSSVCASCHHYRINPAGYAFEGFDELGRARDTDNGAAVDTAGTFAMVAGDIAYSDAASFAAELAESEEAQSCYARRWIEFTYDRDAAREDRCAIEDLGARLSEPGYSVRDLLLDLVQTDAFLNRGAVEAD
jgi:hypothetical protein